MRNKKFLAAVLVVAMMLMGAGYAAWSQSFTINGTVQTGELLVKYHSSQLARIEKLDIPAGYDDCLVDDVNGFDDCYMTVNQGKIDNDTLFMSVEKMYPGSACRSTFRFLNKGTLGVKLNAQTMLDNAELVLDETDLTAAEIASFAVASTELHESNKIPNTFLYDMYLENGIMIRAEFRDHVIKPFDGIVEPDTIDTKPNVDGIQPEYGFLAISFYMPASIGDEANPDFLENVSFELNLTPVFTQFNIED